MPTLSACGTASPWNSPNVITVLERVYLQHHKFINSCVGPQWLGYVISPLQYAYRAIFKVPFEGKCDTTCHCKLI